MTRYGDGTNQLVSDDQLNLSASMPLIPLHQNFELKLSHFLVPEWKSAPFWPILYTGFKFRAFIKNVKVFKGYDITHRWRGRNGVFGTPTLISGTSATPAFCTSSLIWSLKRIPTKQKFNNNKKRIHGSKRKARKLIF
jgi:hypothetical protein